jgi:dTDP-4-amino-4,6-dideoxygalactose transaminase
MTEQPATIPFVDLAAQRTRLGERIDDAIARVLDHGQFILGPEVAELEEELQLITGAENCITCANGTDALTLVLMAEKIGAGDAIIVPSFTFVATAEAVAQLGAVPVFADVQSGTFNIDPVSVERAVSTARDLSLNPRAILAVDLFGQPADYAALVPIAAKNNMLLIADAAQSLGAGIGTQKVGCLADYTTTSFFPAKPLGCYGDGGAIFVRDTAKADLLRSLRFHGKGNEKYDNVRVGLNSRLDTIQAAILLKKLKIFQDELDTRQQVANRYNDHFRECVPIPECAKNHTSSWAQYTLRLNDNAQREAVRLRCAEFGIPTAIYYPAPLHKQTGYCQFPTDPAGLSVSERLSQTVLSLPIHAYLDLKDQDRICEAFKAALGNRR